ncbi:hypothetical protein [Parvularcula sp. LCG005]|uniref:hypothetical protein n=1 Tax=Parvularcula sp. LCG005 TaxID=3078805 RepID=UPI002941C5F7|nr:hypothetical protein [Parvularcula sp. LCG005]WOI52328.1 hypothetical protein RUI03_09205 [Parvularcula sp. LCG005]
MWSRIAAFTLIAGLAACAARMPTIGSNEPPPETPPPITEPTKDWEDWGPEENQARREAAIEGRRLTTTQIDSAFRGRVMRGCYPNGEQFAEFLDTDGRFYNAADNNAFLGQWGVSEDRLCFKYPATADRAEINSCVAVFQTARGFDFYDADLTDKVASTNCSN